MNHQLLLEATQRVGQPFYCYDLDGFEERLKLIQASLRPGIKVWYACKANPLSDILRLLNQYNFGIDVASLGELKQASKNGYEGNDLIATGPAKGPSYLASLLAHEVGCIVIESLSQLQNLNELCGKISRKQNVLLRVQFESEDETKSVVGGNAVTPFGLGVEDWMGLNLKVYPHLNVVGLHSFQWGNILDHNQLRSIWEYTILKGKKLAYDLGIELRVFDLGGGLGVSYQDERQLSFKEVMDTLEDLKMRFELPEIWLELGRYLMGPYGSYLTPIVDVKKVRGKNLIVTEGGINHMARPALVGESFPCSPLIQTDAAKSLFVIHGPLCTALDNLGEYQLPMDLMAGDWLIFNRTGAYGFTESMPFFLCHSLAGEIIIHRQQIKIVRSPENYLEWMV